ncbi:MAG TPA: hypothetical protein VLU47_14545, partial [Blastocatellia bacterium]|nr:hypothetical protein [Blastocatellia bacterium]
PATARELDWVVPQICTSTARVVVTATSTTNAVSSDSSNSDFFINEQGPQINTTNMAFQDGAVRMVFRTVSGTQPLFLSGIKFAISNDAAGSQFFETTKAKVKASGTKLIPAGMVNGQELGVFFPDGAQRLIRFTNPVCGTTLLRVRREGLQLILVAGLQVGTPIWQ